MVEVLHPIEATARLVRASRTAAGARRFEALVVAKRRSADARTLVRGSRALKATSSKSACVDHPPGLALPRRTASLRNLAHVLAATGKRVVLVDCDLRRGHLHRFLGLERAPGVSEVVSRQAPLADATRKTGVETLDFIATGKLPPNPAELAGSRRFQAFLSELSGRYELVLLDTPPILAVTGADPPGARLVTKDERLRAIQTLETVW